MVTSPWDYWHPQLQGQEIETAQSNTIWWWHFLSYCNKRQSFHDRSAQESKQEDIAPELMGATALGVKMPSLTTCIHIFYKERTYRCWNYCLGIRMLVSVKLNIKPNIPFQICKSNHISEQRLSLLQDTFKMVFQLTICRMQSCQTYVMCNCR